MEIPPATDSLSLAKPGLNITHQPGGAGKGLAHPHALFLVNEERVGFDGQVVLQNRFGMNQHLQHVLSISQPLLMALDRLVKLMDLVDKAGKQQKSPLRTPSWGRGGVFPNAPTWPFLITVLKR